jgi:hypothetical protein
METLSEKRRSVEEMQLRANIAKLELRVMEIEEEKEKLLVNIAAQQQRIKELGG